MIDWEEGSVCHADGRRWIAAGESQGSTYLECVGYGCLFLDPAFNRVDFQLNEPREGYYIPKSELDTEGRYNRAVEVFGLFGYEWLNETYEVDYGKFIRFGNLTVMTGSSLACCIDGHPDNLVELTFDQLMTIGELKRKMNERGKSAPKTAPDLTPDFENKSTKKRKSKEAYRTLESMGIEWDNVEGKWFKVSKEWL